MDDTSNGFRHIVLPMSEIYPSVMESVLAVGAIYLSLNQLETPSDYYAIALHHKQRALTCLRNELSTANEASSGHLLVSILMMCLLDVCFLSKPNHFQLLMVASDNGQLPNLMGYSPVRGGKFDQKRQSPVARTIAGIVHLQVLCDSRYHGTECLW